ncbi:diacylglycerol kinase family lipid kinase [Kribbella pittospori]|uniref:Diacylglycerol kinase family lipid kinase n=1 Tax=Kribbella pittospori TaxID=722689 RepID=A0A4R0KCC1_9ACTN|nr:diacylglycerol kinase family protein [Kribbella pittospori]TCC55966.1 diacylglycerol kinase family lipid kinase [Kribbella pittospori]
MKAKGPEIVVVVNPTKVELADVREVLQDAAAVAGVEAPTVVETTEDDPGFGQTRAAVRDGAGLVCALGGDGTVRAVAQELVGTGVAMGLLPGGTGNLLARNLGLPIDSLAEAAAAAFSGRDRTIDVGWLVVDPVESQRAGDLRTGADNVHCFTVMAGVGFDAEIMNDAPEGVKDKAGWAAYVASGGTHLKDDPFALDLVVDGRIPVTGQARAVVVGNCGELTGGMVLLPDAEVDDGRLDVATVSPESLTEWIGVASRVLADRGDGPSLQRDRGRDLMVRVDPPQLCEVDGDVLTEASRLRFAVQPACLVVRVGRDSA